MDGVRQRLQKRAQHWPLCQESLVLPATPATSPMTHWKSGVRVCEHACVYVCVGVSMRMCTVCVLMLMWLRVTVFYSDRARLVIELITGGVAFVCRPQATAGWLLFVCRPHATAGGLRLCFHLINYHLFSCPWLHHFIWYYRSTKVFWATFVWSAKDVGQASTETVAIKFNQSNVFIFY